MSNQALFKSVKHAFHFENAASNLSPAINDQIPAYPSRSSLGETPSTAAVAEVINRARLCTNNGVAEEGWNTWVHQKVLDLAMPGFIKDSDELVQHMLW